MKSKTPTTVTPLLKEQDGPQLVYRIVMGVRHSDQNWKRALNKLISENQSEIQAICAPTACRCSTRAISRSRPDASRARKR